MWADCHLTFLFPLTCSLRASSVFLFLIFYFISLVCDQHCMYVFSHHVFFSFCLSFPFPFSWPPSGLSVSTLACHLKLVSIWFLLFYLPFFPSLCFPPFLICVQRYFSISPSLSTSLWHPLSSQRLNSLERFSRWRAVKPATTYVREFIINLKKLMTLGNLSNLDNYVSHYY